MRSIRFIFPLLLSILLTIGVVIIMSRANETLLLAAPASTVIYVDADATSTPNGQSWSNAYRKLQTALANATSGDEIWVAEGVYYPDEGIGQVNNDANSTFSLTIGVAIYGGFDPGIGINEFSERDWENEVTVLSGDIGKDDITDPNGVVTTTANIISRNAYSVVSSSGVTETSILDGFTITAGKADGEDSDMVGGGMRNWVFADPTLSNLVFSGNYAKYGGGIFIYVSNPTLTNVTFINNEAGNYGGGIANNLSNPSLVDVRFYGNYSNQYGGGMAMYSGGEPILTNVIFDNNEGRLMGGGLYCGNEYNNPTLSTVYFLNNKSKLGGGMLTIDGCSPSLNNVTFSGNSSVNEGGGIGLISADSALTNVTFEGNSAGTDGGGVFVYNRYGSTIITNAIFSGNYAGNNGGGAANINDSYPTYINVTFSSNEANNLGGGLYTDDNEVTVINSILRGNTASDGNQSFDEGDDTGFSHSLIQDSGGSGAGWDTSLGTDAGGNIDDIPLFIRIPDDGGDGWGDDPSTPGVDESANDDYGDLHLQWGSPAIDTGTNTDCPLTDLDGVPRPNQANCDMGAYEYMVGNRAFLPLIVR
jgi:predicted outer membrane repeat protein